MCEQLFLIHSPKPWNQGKILIYQSNDKSWFIFNYSKGIAKSIANSPFLVLFQLHIRIFHLQKEKYNKRLLGLRLHVLTH